MQIIIENNDIKNMDSKILADMLIMIANGNTAPAENDLLAKEVAVAEAEVKTDVAAVPAEEVAEVKAEDIVKVEEPAEEAKPTKKNTRKSKKAETPAPVEEAKKEEPTPEAKAEEADDDEPDFDELDNIEDSEPAPKRTKEEMRKAITAFCNADPKNVKKLKEIASGMGYEKVKDMTEEDMAKMLEKAGI